MKKLLMLCALACALAPSVVFAQGGTANQNNFPGFNPASPGPIGGTTPGTVNGTLITDNQETIQGLALPAVTITQGGTPGSTSYTYAVVGTDAAGKTRSLPQYTNTGNATLSASNFNIITVAAWSAAAPNVAPVGSCNVYRTSGGASQGLIGTIASCAAGGNLQDKALAGDSTTPPVDTSGTLTVTGPITSTNTVLMNNSNQTVANLNLNGAPGNTGTIYGNFQSVNRPSIPFGQYNVTTNYSSYMNDTAGGSFSSTNKSTYSAFDGEIAGGTYGQHLIFNGSVQNYGIGDAEWALGDVRCWGGQTTPGTSSPTCNAVGEFGAQDGNLVFTATVSGSPGLSATTITYTSGVNENVIGARAIFNLTQTTPGTAISISGTTFTTSTASSPFWDNAAAVCNGQGFNVHCNPIGEYIKVTASDVSIGGVNTGHWYKVTAVGSSTTLTLEVAYDTTDLATTGAYVMAQGSEIQTYNTTTKQFTIPANGWTWANNDVLQSPPYHQLSIRGLYQVLTHTFKTGNPTVDDDGFNTIINGQPIDNGMIFSGTGGMRTGINFNTACVQTCISMGSAAGTAVGLFYVSATQKMMGRNGGAGGQGIGFTQPDSINWPGSGGDTVLSEDNTTKALFESVSGHTAGRITYLQAAPAAITTGSGTSIGSTQLCSSTDCPAGTYRVNAYIDITTACGTSGTYVVNLIYTDDQGAKTIPVNINGTGAVPATGVLTTTSTANFGENAQIIRLTSGTINYSTTAVACGSAGPMVGKLYLSVEPIGP